MGARGRELCGKEIVLMWEIVCLKLCVGVRDCSRDERVWFKAGCYGYMLGNDYDGWVF